MRKIKIIFKKIVEGNKTFNMMCPTGMVPCNLK